MIEFNFFLFFFLTNWVLILNPYDCSLYFKLCFFLFYKLEKKYLDECLSIKLKVGPNLVPKGGEQYEHLC